MYIYNSDRGIIIYIVQSMCNVSVIMDLQLRSSCLGIRGLKMEGVQMTAVFEFTADYLLLIRFCEVTKALLFHFLKALRH